MTPLEPGAIVGILGGGQLGRMLAQAAARLGFDAHIYTDEADSPAARVAAQATVGAYDDAAAIAAFASRCKVVTYEFENIDPRAVEAVSASTALQPPARAIAIARDRLAEKAFASDCGAATARHAPVDTRADLNNALAATPPPAILKTRTLGYDGKGQARINTREDADAAWSDLAGAPCILEAMVAFDREVSQISARSAQGDIAHYDLVENDHEAGMLRETIAPAANAAAVAPEARALAERMLKRLDYVGVFTIEFFQVGERLLVNELAPRVHNSGHWTIEGTACDQFEQHIRAITGWPLGATERRGRWRMRNLLGEEANHVSALALDELASVHHYGKRRAAPRRKMGHVTYFDGPD